MKINRFLCHCGKLSFLQYTESEKKIKIRKYETFNQQWQGSAHFLNNLFISISLYIFWFIRHYPRVEKHNFFIHFCDRAILHKIMPFHFSIKWKRKNCNLFLCFYHHHQPHQQYIVKKAFHFLLFSSIFCDDLHDFPFLLHIVREKCEPD